jgi:hypothetical protein
MFFGSGAASIRIAAMAALRDFAADFDHSPAAARGARGFKGLSWNFRSI